MLSALAQSFVFGLLTPLTAVCVLPLYPGFLSFLSSKINANASKKTVFLVGVLAVLGVISFMALLGLIFTTLLQISLTSVVTIVSPLAFTLLGVISIFLIIDYDFSSILPKGKTPTAKNPFVNAFGFGFFFGAIVLPCNPGFIAAFFATSFLAADPVSSMLNFLAFGFGLGFPLLVFATISASATSTIIGFLTKHKSIINRTAGVLMLAASLYYLFGVFKVHQLVF